MKDEIKEILNKLLEYFKESNINDFGYEKDKLISYEEAQILLDYITNLQEKSNNQAEEINRLYKQREKFMKKYGYLKEENESLKELCDKYEEEHSTTFNEWKETITDKYQTLKDLQEENEKLQKRNKEIYDGFIATQEELSDYATRNEKAIEYINHEIFKRTILVGVGTKKYTRNILDNVLNILNGDDEE